MRPKKHIRRCNKNENKIFGVIRQDLTTSSSWAAYLVPRHCTPRHIEERFAHRDVFAERLGLDDIPPPPPPPHLHKHMSRHGHPSLAVDYSHGRGLLVGDHHVVAVDRVSVSLYPTTSSTLSL